MGLCDILKARSGSSSTDKGFILYEIGPPVSRISYAEFTPQSNRDTGLVTGRQIGCCIPHHCSGNVMTEGAESLAHISGIRVAVCESPENNHLAGLGHILGRHILNVILSQHDPFLGRHVCGVSPGVFQILISLACACGDQGDQGDGYQYRFHLIVWPSSL